MGVGGTIAPDFANALIRISGDAHNLIVEIAPLGIDIKSLFAN